MTDENSARPFLMLPNSTEIVEVFSQLPGDLSIGQLNVMFTAVMTRSAGLVLWKSLGLTLASMPIDEAFQPQPEVPARVGDIQ